MRSRTLSSPHVARPVACALFLLAAGPASAQLTAGPGSSNAANQSFQTQNQIQGLSQQQQMNFNQIQGQIRSNQLYNGAGQVVGPRVVPGGRRR